MKEVPRLGLHWIVPWLIQSQFSPQQIHQWWIIHVLIGLWCIPMTCTHSLRRNNSTMWRDVAGHIYMQTRLSFTSLWVIQVVMVDYRSYNPVICQYLTMNLAFNIACNLPGNLPRKLCFIQLESVVLDSINMCGVGSADHMYKCFCISLEL